MLDWHLFDDRESLTEALSDAVVTRLQAAIEERGSASLMVSGGSTPAPLYHALSGVDLPWGQVVVALVDERWVSEDYMRSNTGFIKRTLLQNKAGEARFVPMTRPTDTPFDAVGDIEADYRTLPYPFDVVILGLGPDGHTASLFPEARGLDDAFEAPMDQLVAPIEAISSDVTGSEVLRMTLTPQAIADAEACFLMITGARKKAVAEEVTSAAGSGLPLGRLLRLMDRALPVYFAP